MKLAIQSENIMYSRFKRKFKEMWGRHSVRYWGDAWVDSMAYGSTNGVATFGANRIYLFMDGVVDFKYTKELCKVINADYDSLYAQRGDVSSFYIDLTGISRNNVDFTDPLIVKEAMEDIVNTLASNSIDKIEISFVADAEFVSAATASMSLSTLRALPIQIDYNTGEYAEGTTPSVKYFTLPTYKEVVTIEDSPPPPEGQEPLPPIETISLEEVEGVEITLANTELDMSIGLMGVNTNLLDLCIGTPTLTTIEVGERIVEDSEAGIYEVYKLYQCVLTFGFGSRWDFSDEENIHIVNLIDWDYLSSSVFANDFSNKTREHKAWMDWNYENATGVEPTKEVIVYAALITHFESFNPLDVIFYSAGSGNVFNIPYTWLRTSPLEDISNKDFSNLIMKCIYLGYSKKKSGWFGGSIIGKILEMVFVMVVVVAGIILSIVLFNPLPLAIAMAALFVTVKFTNMSVSGTQFALFGIKALGAAGIAFGVYGIYDITYNLTIEAATAEALAAGTNLAEVEATIAATEITATDVLLQLGVVNGAKLAAQFYGAFNLLTPVSGHTGTSNQDETAEQQDNSVYYVDTAYDLYDNYLTVYDYE